MFYVVGLGNPGDMYTDTRHNVGWMMLSHIQEVNGLPSFVDRSAFVGRISEGVLYGKDVLLLMPVTYMNKSGSSVKKVVTKKEDIKQLVVMYDDVDLAIGDIKISVGKGSGGHNGVQSVIDALGTKDFIRIRIGVASRGFFGTVKRPKGERLSSHVLGTFKLRERKQLEEVAVRIDTAVKILLTEGVEKAMSVCN